MFIADSNRNFKEMEILFFSLVYLIAYLKFHYVKNNRFDEQY